MKLTPLDLGIIAPDPLNPCRQGLGTIQDKQGHSVRRNAPRGQITQQDLDDFGILTTALAQAQDKLPAISRKAWRATNC